MKTNLSIPIIFIGVYLSFSFTAVSAELSKYQQVQHRISDVTAEFEGKRDCRVLIKYIPFILNYADERIKKNYDNFDYFLEIMDKCTKKIIAELNKINIRNERRFSLIADNNKSFTDAFKYEHEEIRVVATAATVHDPLPPETSVVAQNIDLNIYFDVDSAIIRSEFNDSLQEVADLLLERPSRVILIEGHTDERGTPEYNLKLSDMRAAAVTNYLISLGVYSEQITTVGYGEEKLNFRFWKVESQARNRRVVITLIKY